MKSVYLEILLSCPLNCVFCSQGLRKRYGPQDLSDLKAFIDDYAKQDFGKIIITGGEPFLHPDLIEILEYVNDSGIKEVSIQTSGVHLNEKLIKKLKNLITGQLIFSIHSHDEKVVDELMRGEGVLEKQLKGLSLAIKNDIHVSVTTVILKQNYRGLSDFFKFMIKNYPEIYHYTLNYVDAIGSSTDNKDVVPKYSESEPFIAKALLVLTKLNKSFRFERIPLCYALEFAENNTELRRIITDEQNKVNRAAETVSYDKQYFDLEYVKSDVCKICTLNEVCPGIDKDYAEIYGTDELYPVFVDPKKIIERSGAD